MIETLKMKYPHLINLLGTVRMDSIEYYTGLIMTLKQACNNYTIINDKTGLSLSEFIKSTFFKTDYAAYNTIARQDAVIREIGSISEAEMNEIREALYKQFKEAN